MGITFWVLIAVLAVAVAIYIFLVKKGKPKGSESSTVLPEIPEEKEAEDSEQL